jgi:hypothetical protein
MNRIKRKICSIPHNPVHTFFSECESLLASLPSVCSFILQQVPTAMLLVARVCSARAVQCKGQSPLQTLITCALGFNQNYYTFTLTLLIEIILCSKLLSID